MIAFAAREQSITGSPVIQSSASAHAFAVAASPCLWQEHVAELGLLGVRSDMTGTLSAAAVELDRADHRTVEIDEESAGAPPWNRLWVPETLLAALTCSVDVSGGAEFAHAAPAGAGVRLV